MISQRQLFFIICLSLKTCVALCATLIFLGTYAWAQQDTGLPTGLKAQAKGDIEVSLIMVEQAGCIYCAQWHKDIGPIYAKTKVGLAAPLHSLDLSAVKNFTGTLQRGVVFTPTFLLMVNDIELERIEGYPGEDFFWGLLEMQMTKHKLW